MTTVAIDLSKVTPEQIGKAHKVFGPDNKPFYMVENSRGECDADGHLIEYTVKAIKVNGQWFLTCNCKAGQDGRLCWHKRASMAAAAEEKTAMAEQVALNKAAKEVEQEAVKPVQKKAESRQGEKLHQSRERGRLAILEAMHMARNLK